MIESTFNWYWLVDGLMDRGYQVHLANTTAIEQYNGLKHMPGRSTALTNCPSTSKISSGWYMCWS